MRDLQGSLALVLEPGAGTFWGIVPFAGLLIAVVAGLLWHAWRAGWTGFGPRQWIACAICTGLGIALMAQPVGWQLRLDDKGIVLAAPFDVMGDRGAIPWEELRDIRFATGQSRSNTAVVQFVGAPGTVLVLKVIGGVPDAYWPAMAAIVEAKSAFRFPHGKDDWVASARQLARQDNGLFGWTYVVKEEGER